MYDESQGFLYQSFISELFSFIDFPCDPKKKKPKPFFWGYYITHNGWYIVQWDAIFLAECGEWGLAF